MLSFNTEPYSFEVDGKPYMLPKLGFGDLEQTSAIGASISENPAEGIALVRELLVKKADARTLEAIDTLAIGDVVRLIRDWIGLTPGESSASAE